MNFFKLTQSNGFSLIEALLGLAIFSICLQIFWQTQTQTIKYLSKSLKISAMQSELNRISETMLAYPEWDENSKNDVKKTISIVQHHLYREVIICSELKNNPCLSAFIPNQKVDFLSSNSY